MNEVTAPLHSERSSKRAAISAAGFAAVLGRPPGAILLSIAALVHLAIVIDSALPRYRHLDFASYYAAGVAIRAGEDPYRVDLLQLSARLGLDSGEMVHVSETPPFLAAFEPLTLLAPRPAHRLWLCLNVVLLAASLWMLLRPGGPPPRLRLTLAERTSVAALVLLYPPVAQNLVFAQSQIVILFLLVVAMRALDRNREATAGAAIALAGLLRAYPLLLLVYLVLRRRWRAVQWAGIIILTGIALTFAVLGIERSLHWIQVLSWTTGVWQAGRAFNVAVGGFVSRVFWYSFGAHLSRSIDVARHIAVLLAQLTFLAFTVLASRRAGPSHDDDRRIYSLWAATCILISPIAWPHYMVILIIPLAMLTGALRDGSVSSRAVWMAVANFVLAALWLELWAEPVLSAARYHYVPNAALLIFGEGGFVAALAGYLAAYWFASDAALSDA